MYQERFWIKCLIREEGHSQHMIAKVLDMSQPAIYGVIRGIINELS